MASIGLISDTHGLLRDEALDALAGSDFIVHAGDIGEASILARLRMLAPVTAVRGNNDTGTWASRIPDTQVLDVAGFRLYIVHALQDLDVDARSAGFHAVISGH